MSSTSSTTAVDPERAKESNTAMILAVTGTFHALALVFVVLRTYTRAAIVKTIGIDDYMMIMSAVSHPYYYQGCHNTKIRVTMLTCNSSVR